MPGFRVTERSVATNTLANLQVNLQKNQDLQNQLSSGKQITKASDSPGGAVIAMQTRSDMATLNQYSRNGDDGMGWLNQADTALTSASTQLNRARELVLTGMSSGTGGDPQAREAIAQEMDNLRGSLLDLANTTYLDRPIFGGTTAGNIAYDQNGVYKGDTGQVNRTIGANATVRVDTDAASVFGADPDNVFTTLGQIADDLRNNPAALQGDLAKVDTAQKRVQTGLSGVGSRYNQVSQMQQAAENRVLDLRTQLSNVEDIDLPKTITELSLQQTAYQAALAATAKVVQPSLVDFLR
ncbi:flagellar hook-associated protein FlgL [Dactylosporangium matsuzakiense]|uniref:Flagellar hook-associated protein FlgL n=1 Tax=Dactylosporangium matsuzakiense TaxID=53360 RepID=A0A9W6NRW1_9ACTN|nr:flagellar hook-associated protein FlgL [Dactylosporangium matsuzakiense]UWZ43787.1 flagellar hook-associated protein FlgL [Dactylosporangium matsuzakiense]GLL06838.1 flagellar hook-associated protein FlgL [Dactylosporangium matsuzakiense]